LEEELDKAVQRGDAVREENDQLKEELQFYID